jgi:indolepyruvate ferredoxin oxidoreductase alpha subunit
MSVATRARRSRISWTCSTDAEDILGELGVHFEASASEATAAATLAASVHYPIRGAVTWKGTVGTNVASDALANLASGGVKGGALIIVGEDYGEGSSIMQERSHAFAMKSQIWLLDPRPNLQTIVDLVETGFELSEASNTPVMLEIRIRTCHLHGRFVARDNKAPAFTVKDALEQPRRETSRIVLPPASYAHEHEKINVRLPAAIKFIRERKLNEVFDVPGANVGIILQGGMYNGVVRALERLGLADIWGNTAVPLYVLNVTYPLIEDEVLDFCRDKDAVLVVEEGQPDYLEQALSKMLRNAGIGAKLLGKGPFPMAGEYTAKVMSDGIGTFLRGQAPALLPDRVRAPNLPDDADAEMMKELAAEVPMRPAGFCTGCPERPIFAAMKLVEKRARRPTTSASDIGCHLFSILPPFNIGATTMGYGLGLGRRTRPSIRAETQKRPIAVMGDGGFWHNGLTSGVTNAVFNKHRWRHWSSSTTGTPPPPAGRTSCPPGPTTRAARPSTRSSRLSAASASTGSGRSTTPTTSPRSATRSRKR